MRRISWVAIGWMALGALLVLASALLSTTRSTPLSVSILLCVMVAVVVAWRAGFRASVMVSVIATLCLDHFGAGPRAIHHVASPHNIVSLAAFAVVSLLISHLSDHVRVKADELYRSEAQQRALYEISRVALLIEWKTSVDEQLCALVQNQLHLAGVALWDAREARFSCIGDTTDAWHRIQAAFRSDRNYDLPNRSESLRILRFGVRSVGGILFRGDIEPLTADAVATLIATRMERVRALRAEVTAEAQAVSERLRTTVLDGLAHAVKTPLTTIVVSSSGLKELGGLTPLQDELAQTIEEQAAYLTALTDKLLKTAKLEKRELLVQSRSTRLSEVFGGAFEELRPAYDITRIEVQGLIDVEVRLDPDLCQMGLVQLLENALKYSADRSKVRVIVSVENDELSVTVHNEGSYIAEAERGLIFERYFRSNSVQHRAPGTGVGLSVARHALEAQGGRIGVESTVEHGTRFQILLPI